MMECFNPYNLINHGKGKGELNSILEWMKALRSELDIRSDQMICESCVNHMETEKNATVLTQAERCLKRSISIESTENESLSDLSKNETEKSSCKESVIIEAEDTKTDSLNDCTQNEVEQQVYLPQKPETVQAYIEEFQRELLQNDIVDEHSIETIINNNLEEDKETNKEIAKHDFSKGLELSENASKQNEENVQIHQVIFLNGKPITLKLPAIKLVRNIKPKTNSQETEKKEIQQQISEMNTSENQNSLEIQQQNITTKKMKKNQVMKKSMDHRMEEISLTSENIEGHPSEKQDNVSKVESPQQAELNTSENSLNNDEVLINTPEKTAFQRGSEFEIVKIEIKRVENETVNDITEDFFKSVHGDQTTFSVENINVGSRKVKLKIKKEVEHVFLNCNKILHMIKCESKSCQNVDCRSFKETIKPSIREEIEKNIYEKYNLMFWICKHKQINCTECLSSFYTEIKHLTLAQQSEKHIPQNYFILNSSDPAQKLATNIAFIGTIQLRKNDAFREVKNNLQPKTITKTNILSSDCTTQEAASEFHNIQQSSEKDIFEFTDSTETMLESQDEITDENTNTQDESTDLESSINPNNVYCMRPENHYAPEPNSIDIYPNSSVPVNYNNIASLSEDPQIQQQRFGLPQQINNVSSTNNVATSKRNIALEDCSESKDDTIEDDQDAKRRRTETLKPPMELLPNTMQKPPSCQLHGVYPSQNTTILLNGVNYIRNPVPQMQPINMVPRNVFYHNPAIPFPSQIAHQTNLPIFNNKMITAMNPNFQNNMYMPNTYGVPINLSANMNMGMQKVPPKKPQAIRPRGNLEMSTHISENESGSSEQTALISSAPQVQIGTPQRETPHTLQQHRSIHTPSIQPNTCFLHPNMVPAMPLHPVFPYNSIPFNYPFFPNFPNPNTMMTNAHFASNNNMTQLNHPMMINMMQNYSNPINQQPFSTNSTVVRENPENNTEEEKDDTSKEDDDTNNSNEDSNMS